MEFILHKIKKIIPVIIIIASLITVPVRAPWTLIQDGQICRENLALAGKDEAWLETTLNKHSARRETTLLLTVDDSGRVLWLGKEGQ